MCAQCSPVINQNKESPNNQVLITHDSLECTGSKCTNMACSSLMYGLGWITINKAIQSYPFFNRSVQEDIKIYSSSGRLQYLDFFFKVHWIGKRLSFKSRAKAICFYIVKNNNTIGSSWGFVCSAGFDLLKLDFHVENEFCLFCSESILKDSWSVHFYQVM